MSRAAGQVISLETLKLVNQGKSWARDTPTHGTPLCSSQALACSVDRSLVSPYSVK